MVKGHGDLINLCDYVEVIKMISYNNETTDTAKICFDNFININELLNKDNVSELSIVDINIGYDKKVYILLSSNIPGRINGMFVSTVANADYSVLELSMDWESGTLINLNYYELGRHKTNFHFIQPIKDKLLLLGARSYYRSNSGGEENAFIMDRTGEVYNKFCFGDGIAECIALSDGKIITSYFDEGIFGNYGWDEPIGERGLVVWNENGEIIWQANHDIFDCYAINTDEAENLWFYFYTDFNLVKTDFKTEKIYTPDISGANAFFLTNDLQHIIFDKGYQNHGKYLYAPITYNKIGVFKPLEFVYQDQEIECSLFKSRSSLVIINDSHNRIFVKNIISI